MLKWIIAGIALFAIIGAVSGGGDDKEKATASAKPTVVKEQAVPKKQKPQTKRQKATACFESVGYTVERNGSDMLKVNSPSGRPQAILNRGIGADAAYDDVVVGKWTVTFWNDGGDEPARTVITDCASKL